MKVYLVGGAVRDKLLNLPIKERDWVVVGSDPTQMLHLGYRQVGRGFPVFLHPETQEEYALARTEKKSGVGYYGFSCDANPGVTLEQDLSRRDLTINAIAMDNEGTLIDPYHGQKDLHRKQLRHVSAAFVEDPVRVLRLARFMARFQPLGFQVAPETQKLIQTMVRSVELAHLVAERVWQEWQQSLLEPNPPMFITTLRSCGALKVILPEIDCLFGVPNSIDTHPEIDTGVHSLLALAAASALSSDPVLRFAALVHDLGKACTSMASWPQHHDHDILGSAVIADLCKRLSIPNHYQQLARLAARWHVTIHRLAKASAADILQVLNQTRAFHDPELFEQLLLVCRADAHGRGLKSLNDVHPVYRQANEWRVLLTACQQINAQIFVDQGYKGAAIKEALYQARLDCINRMRLT